jgi:two-component system sensor histidine kinase KdpD
MPVDNIIGTVRSLNQNWDEAHLDEKHSLINLIEMESSRLDRFVQNLLDMTELVTGTIHLNLAQLDIRTLIKDVISHLSRRVGERVIRFDCSEALPLIEGDADILRRVFINIIENACTYSPFDQPITIKATSEGTQIKIAFNDRGAGIPESERERVFDMFYRIKSGATQSGAGGAGLGLSICRGFIEAHQGQISARQGEDGVGTKIVIRLPLKAQI